MTTLPDTTPSDALQAVVLVSAHQAARTFGEGPSAVVAVHGATCQIQAGDQIALTGPSGSGKSTLTHLLAGLDTPTTGTLEWPAIGTRSELRPGNVAVVFQTSSLLPPLNVVENVELPLLLDGVEGGWARIRSEVALRQLGLADLANKLPEELSGGQAQRVAVARALAGEPRLILADEPTGQLDHHNAEMVIEALITAAHHLKAGLLVNTHDPRISSRLPKHWHMHDGRLSTQPDPGPDPGPDSDPGTGPGTGPGPDAASGPGATDRESTQP